MNAITADKEAADAFWALTEQLQALCEEFGCDVGENRIEWLRTTLSALKPAAPSADKYDELFDRAAAAKMMLFRAPADTAPRVEKVIDELVDEIERLYAEIKWLRAALADHEATVAALTAGKRTDHE